MATVRDIIVDDSDPRIIYSGDQTSWTTDTTGLNDIGTYGLIYNSTSHRTNSSRSLEFAFTGKPPKPRHKAHHTESFFQTLTGTAISAYGTNIQTSFPNNTYTPGFQCIIDQSNFNQTGESLDRQNNWDLCDAKNLSPGLHVLFLQVETYGQPFWLDYLRYTPLPDATFSNETVAIHVQSNDSAIHFTSAWVTLQGGPSFEGVKYTSTVGQTMNFSFIGTRIDWYGWILPSVRHNPASASYTIDGSVNGTFTFGTTPLTNVTHPNALFFSTPELSLGPHALVVIYNGGVGTQPTPLSLEYLILTGSDPPIGVIVGGVVGCLATIAFSLFILLWWRRLRDSRPPDVEALPPTTVEPFTLMEQQLPPIMRPGASGKGIPP
ncbi:hypothetical protein C0991_001582 [Blastosporella zonata]|nr:hypothetical protein C0991_001582 [Blastosporella zonata]